jgi:hypothetical protein
MNVRIRGVPVHLSRPGHHGPENDAEAQTTKARP